MQTQLYTYQHDLSTKEGEEAYLRLSDTLMRQSEEYGAPRNVLVFLANPNANKSYYLGVTPPEGATITLDPRFLFGDQWNVASDSPKYPDYRVFDWVEERLPNRSLKRGHFLKITDEMTGLRQSTYKCGYCGHQTQTLDGRTFCDKCLGSPYLKAEELRLLRFRTIAEDRTYKSPELTQGELDGILPAYVAAQTRGASERRVEALATERREVLKKAETACQDAETEREGMLWLLDRQIGTRNVLFYSHTGKFKLGWLNPVDPATRQEWERLLEGFPGAIEVRYAE